MRKLSWLSSGPVLQSFLFVALGLRIMTAKRPLVLPARWIPVGILACVIPGEVADFVDPPVPLVYLLLGPAIFAAFGLLCWILLRGYIVLAATEDQLDAALAETLTRLQQPFEQTQEGMRLTAQDAMLNVRMGLQDVWSLSISPRARRCVLATVARGMRAYFGSRIERGSQSASYALFAVGAIMLLLQVFEAILFGL